MENIVYTVDYFISKYKAIPEELFIVGSPGRREYVGNTPHCALGWCKGSDGQFGMDFVDQDGDELKSLKSLFHGFFIPYYYVTSSPDKAIAAINDGDNPDYQQPTPKQRILAALYDIKAKQQPEVRERIVYVTVDAPVRELQKTELIEN